MGKKINKKNIFRIFKGFLIYPILLYVLLIVTYGFLFYNKSDCNFYIWIDINLKSIQVVSLLYPILLGLVIINANENRVTKFAMKINFLITFCTAFIFYKLGFMRDDFISLLLLIFYTIMLLILTINKMFHRKFVKSINIILCSIILLFLLDSINMRFFLDSIKDIHTILMNDKTKIEKSKFDKIRQIDLHYSFVFERDTIEITEENYSSYPANFYNEKMIENIKSPSSNEKYFAIWNQVNVKFYPINKNSEYIECIFFYNFINKVWTKYNLLQVYPQHLYKKVDGFDSLLEVKLFSD